MNILVIDIGGTNVKIWTTGEVDKAKVPSGKHLTPEMLVEEVFKVAAGWKFDRVTIGYPGEVRHGHPVAEPFNLGDGWVDFDYAAAFKVPVRIMNDACMQALGSYEGGRMLFLGLGTGLGTTLIIDKVIAPMELAHLPYRKGRTFEDYVGERGLVKLGKKKWHRAVFDVTMRLKAALVADYVVLGGGNAKKLEELPPGARLGNNANAFTGGFRLWHDYE